MNQSRPPTNEMDVPAEILAELKCHKCDLYLSRGPVYLEHGGAAACGRCFSPKRPATRNKEYEAVAKLLRFPCKNRELGCGETVDFEEVAHEVTCSYRQYVCPVLGSSRCEWLGTRNQLLQHCQEQHPDHLLDNPCSLTHDITTSSLHNYELQAVQLLFLLLTKVCVISERIYHSVRLLDSDDMAQDFSYKLHVRRGDEEVTKRGDVVPQGCLSLQEPTALGLDVNDLLGGWGGATFTVAVERREKCSRCEAEVTVKLYYDESGWQCERCAPTRRVCRNQVQGCRHQDIPGKCHKHELYFCRKSTKCWICEERVPRVTLSTHYTSRHRDVTHSAGSTWRASWTGGQWQHCIVTCPAGTAVCSYWLYDSVFDLLVYIPVSSERLCEFRCEIRVTHLNTRRTRTYTPDVGYMGSNDWYINIKKDFPSRTGEFDITVNIFKL